MRYESLSIADAEKLAADLEGMTVKQLLEFAARHGAGYVSGITKKKLVKAIRDDLQRRIAQGGGKGAR